MLCFLLEVLGGGHRWKEQDKRSGESNIRRGGMTG